MFFFSRVCLVGYSLADYVLVAFKVIVNFLFCCDCMFPLVFAMVFLCIDVLGGFFYVVVLRVVSVGLFVRGLGVCIRLGIRGLSLSKCIAI